MPLSYKGEDVRRVRVMSSWQLGDRNMKVENLRSFVSELILPEGFKGFRDIITLDYGEKSLGSEGISQIKITLPEGDEITSKQSFCGCTKLDYRKIDGSYIIDIGYNTKIRGPFTKQVNLYTSGKDKQIIKIQGNIL